MKATLRAGLLLTAGVHFERDDASIFLSVSFSFRVKFLESHCFGD